MGELRRVGIMGGTFDPVHMVHLILAENAYRQFGLDEIIMLPSGDPPHKTEKHVTLAAMRYDMLSLACEGVEYFRVDDMEMKREGRSYTEVTLTELHEEHPDTEYYFIMGADSVFQIESWYHPGLIMKKCIILAAVRDNVGMEAFRERIEYLKEKYGADIRILDLPDLEMSSSDIRKRISEGRSIRFMVPEKVLSYIQEHDLYKREQ